MNTISIYGNFQVIHKLHIHVLFFFLLVITSRQLIGTNWGEALWWTIGIALRAHSFIIVGEPSLSTRWTVWDRCRMRPIIPVVIWCQYNIVKATLNSQRKSALLRNSARISPWGEMTFFGEKIRTFMLFQWKDHIKILKNNNKISQFSKCLILSDNR